MEMAPLVRVNGVAPATVVKGSAMFPRDRVIASLAKYKIPFQDAESTEGLREKLAGFYARRTLTQSPIEPEDQAEATSSWCEAAREDHRSRGPRGRGPAGRVPEIARSEEHMTEPLQIAVDLGAGSGRVFLAGVGAGELLLEEVRRFHYPARPSGCRCS